jgi:hypothetical protein
VEGLTDGSFSYQKGQFWYLWEGLEMENIGILHARLVFLFSFWYILWPFGIFLAILVYFSHAGLLDQEKSGKPAQQSKSV